MSEEKIGITMASIANELGISKITVSRALSGHASVKEKTRIRVKEAAEKLGYRMNVSARNLRLQRSQAIAVVIEMTPSHDRSMMEPYPLSLLGGIMEELTIANFNLVLTTIDLFHSSPPSVDGVILLGQGIHEDAVGVVKQTGLPFCVWGAEHGGDVPVVVGSDNVQGGRIAAEHLLSSGRRKVLFLGDVGHAEVEDRLSGFQSALIHGGGAVIDILPCNFTSVDGKRVMSGFLSARGEAAAIDAVFASSDAIAMGAIEALAAFGVQVPADVSVVGFDDSPGGALFTPRLTSIRQDWEQGGRVLAQKVLKLIQGDSVTSSVLPVTLTMRESSVID